MTAEGHARGVGSQLARSGFHLVGQVRIFSDVDIGYLDTLSRLLVDDTLQLLLRLFLALHSLFQQTRFLVFTIVSKTLRRRSIINWSLQF